MKNLIWTTTAVVIYWGYPWKEPFYKNIPFLVLFLLNLIASIAYFFITPSISDVFSVHPISIMTGEILFVITLGQIIVNTIYQSLLHYHDLHIVTW
jgi:magnesium-transporting ATPase (P-type)